MVQCLKARLFCLFSWAFCWQGCGCGNLSSTSPPTVSSWVHSRSLTLEPALVLLQGPPALQPCFLASPPLPSPRLSIAQGPQYPLSTSSYTRELGLHANYAKKAIDQEVKGKMVLIKKIKQRMHQSHGGGNAWPVSTEGPSFPQPHHSPQLQEWEVGQGGAAS